MKTATATQTKHTPGPWSSPAQDMVTTGIGTICAVWKPDRFTGGSQQANAHLIAAAPELLEACKRVRAMLDSMQMEPEIRKLWSELSYIGSISGSLNDLDSAIAKAAGEPCPTTPAK